MNEDPLEIDCPSCQALAGEACERRFRSKVWRTPCTIRRVIADRRRSPGCYADQMNLGNDVLVDLLRSSAPATSKQLYCKLVK